MKFSELSTDRAADVLCEVSVCALNILTDDELRESLKAQIDAEKPQTAGERYAIGAQKIGQWIPLILKSTGKIRLVFWLRSTKRLLRRSKSRAS